MAIKLTKAQREELRLKFDGRCAYCGDPLGKIWHADHVEAIERKLRYVRGRAVPTGELYRPENDRIDNFNPACPPCNIDKHAMSLEGWRRKLATTLDVLRRNNPTYRHGLRFGLIVEVPVEIVFYFEKVAAAAAVASSGVKVYQVGNVVAGENAVEAT